MKGKGICTIGFILWILVFCTILSVYIERQMTNPVVSIEPVKKQDTLGDGLVPLDVLTEYGTEMTVFEMRNDKDGWKKGLRVWPLESGYLVGAEDITIIGALSEPYILRYASRPVLPGQLVEVTTQLETGEYSYLLVKETGQAEVFTVSGARPFMSKQTKSLLEIPQEYELYMVEDVLDFFRTLPWLFGILSVLCCSVFLWLYCLLGWKKIRKSRRRMVINVSLGAGLLAVSLWLTGKMNFPASLLPKNNMLEFWYYKEEFRKIFQALFDASAKTAGMVSDTLQTSVLSGIGILVIGTLTFIFLTILINKKGEC